MENRSILKVNHIVKEYPGVVALNDVSVDFKEGEIHALVGENGAGKSTLVKIISGAISPTKGEIEISGQRFSHMTPQSARKQGIAIIYQEFNLVSSLSVAENLFLGNFIGNGIVVDRKEMNRRTQEIFDEMKVPISPDEIVGNLSTAYMQLVEIAKAVIKDVKFLIMDEPTAPLTNAEVEILFSIVEKLKKKGVTIVYISHRLNEIFSLADTVTVMRDGCWISTRDIKETNRERMISEMVGREVTETYPERHVVPGDKVLEVRHLSGKGVKNISFSVRAGEVLGLAGLVGAGRTETVRMIFGADKAEQGEIYLNGEKLHLKSPKDAVDKGIALVPEDRKLQGVVLGLSIKDNITLPTIKKLSKVMVIDSGKESEVIDTQIRELRIKTPSAEQLVKNLSGGNQQKVVLAKWLASNANVLIFDEPTRGIDIGAKQEIYHLINKLAEQGIAIIVVSSEMEEIMGMSDRILVLCEGEVTGEIDRKEFQQDTIMSMASGTR